MSPHHSKVVDTTGRASHSRAAVERYFRDECPWEFVIDMSKTLAKKRKHDSTTQDGEFTLVKSTLRVSVAPTFAGNPRAGVEEMLDSMIMRCVQDVFRTTASNPLISGTFQPCEAWFSCTRACISLGTLALSSLSVRSSSAMLASMRRYGVHKSARDSVIGHPGFTRFLTLTSLLFSGKDQFVLSRPYLSSRSSNVQCINTATTHSN
jgi:hypothetical protein